VIFRGAMDYWLFHESDMDEGERKKNKLVIATDWLLLWHKTEGMLLLG